MSILSILKSVLLIVEALSAFLLIVVILAQKSKDQGLGMAFGGGMGESLFGSRAGNVLTRMTVTLASVFMATTILLGILFARGGTSSGSVMEKADREMPMAASSAPMASAPAPMQPSPMAAEELPVATAEESSAPVMMQMNESGELAPVAAPEVVEETVVVEEAPAAVEPVTEGEPAPQE